VTTPPPKEAFRRVGKSFPFAGYLEARIEACRDISATLLEHRPPPGRVLDFGAGPCEQAAILQVLGYEVAAIDDLGDRWHGLSDNRERIVEFAAEFGVDLHVGRDLPARWEAPFDVVMLHDVIEHLHDSPREILDALVGRLRDGGLLFITVPNAVNLRKRLQVLRGRTNYPDFASYYWLPAPWRGHVREYTRGDLEQLVDYLGLELVDLRAVHHHVRHRLPSSLSALYRATTSIVPNTRDTWSLLARRPPGFQRRADLDEARMRQLLARETPYRG
jgi:SAM-dependent methyltransferase